MTQENFPNNLTITNETRTKIPAVSWGEIKNKILGKNYELSLVFPNKKTAIELHEDWKNKPGPVNILSFLLIKILGKYLYHSTKQKLNAKTLIGNMKIM